MGIQLKPFSAFPNWPLALEFLRRSQRNYVVAHETPPAGTPEHLSDRVIVQRNDGENRCLTVPAYWDREQIAAVCGTLHNRMPNRPQHFIGSIRGSNFVSFLNEFAQILVGKFEMKEVAQAITNKTSDLFEAEGASILVPNEKGTKFRFAYFQTRTRRIRNKLDMIEVPANKGVTGWVARHRKSILIEDTANNPLFNPEIDARSTFKTKNIVAAPIQIGEELIGILQVVNKKSGGFQDSDLQILELIASIIAIFIEKAQLFGEKVKFARMQRELEIAHAIQTELMPPLPTTVGPFRLSGESLPISKVGGDFWEISELNEHEKLLIIGDVSGHGLGAAMVMSAVRTASRAMLPQIRSPYDLILPLNQFIHREFGVKGHYMTLIVCHLDSRSHKVNYFRAGHECPILRTGDRFVKLEDSVGLPIGLLPFRREDCWGSFQLKPGDSLYLFTDGVLDGLSEEEVDLVAILNQNPALVQSLEKGMFFKTFKRDFGWRDKDDATFLRLSTI